MLTRILLGFPCQQCFRVQTPDCFCQYKLHQHECSSSKKKLLQTQGLPMQEVAPAVFIWLGVQFVFFFLQAFKEESCIKASNKNELNAYGK